MPHAVIIGGGISGLATAFYLQRLVGDQAQLDCTLFERESRLGGKIVTDTVDEFVIEGGPDSCIAYKPAALQLADDLGLADDIISTNPKAGAFILNRGKLAAFPAGFRMTAPTQAWPFLKSPLLSIPGKLRVFGDLFIPARSDTADESVADFVSRRFGREMLEGIAGPLMSGIYSTLPERLSMSCAFPQFVAIEKQHGSLIRGMRASAKKRKSAPAPRIKSAFFSFRSGMSQLVHQLKQQLHATVRLNEPVQRIVRHDSGFAVETETETVTADVVILATPANISMNLVAEAFPDLSQALGAFEFVSTANVSLGFRLADLPGGTLPAGYGFIVPPREGHRIAACTWSSSKLENRAAADHVLLRLFLGGQRDPDAVNLSDEQLVDLACGELKTIMGISSPPIMHRVFRWHNANPQYDVGHLSRVTRAEEAAVPGLAITGSSYRGVGVPDCIKNGKETATKLAEFLRAQARS